MNYEFRIKNYIKVPKTGQDGYIALISVIIISLLLITVITALSTINYFSRYNILENEYKERSSGLAEGCVDYALGLRDYFSPKHCHRERHLQPYVRYPSSIRAEHHHHCNAGFLSGNHPAKKLYQSYRSCRFQFTSNLLAGNPELAGSPSVSSRPTECI